MSGTQQAVTALEKQLPQSPQVVVVCELVKVST